MSLDIIAINKKNQEAKFKEWLNKYNVPKSLNLDKDKPVLYTHDFNNAIELASQLEQIQCCGDSAHYLTNNDYQWLKSVQEKYHVKPRFYSESNIYFTEIEMTADLMYNDLQYHILEKEEDRYHIGYIAFHYVNKLLSPYFGVQYYYKNYDKSGHPDVFSLYLNSPDSYLTDPTGQAIIKYFCHSDSDGEYLPKDLKLLSQFIQDHDIINRVEKYKHSIYKDNAINLLKFFTRNKNYKLLYR